MKFNAFSMTFQGPFQAVMAGIILEKVTKCTKIYPASLGLRHIPFTMINLLIKHKWKACKIVCLFPYC